MRLLTTIRQTTCYHWLSVAIIQLPSKLGEKCRSANADDVYKMPCINSDLSTKNLSGRPVRNAVSAASWEWSPAAVAEAVIWWNVLVRYAMLPRSAAKRSTLAVTALDLVKVSGRS